MSSIKKFAWADTGLFTLTGSPYVGFYNVYNNTAYAGISGQQVKLTNVDKIFTTLSVSDLFLNRLPGENFTLTYTLSDFIFQPNEFINSNSIDNKLNKLYVNYLETYKSCFMASSKLPLSGTIMSGVAPKVVGSDPNVWYFYSYYYPYNGPYGAPNPPYPLSNLNADITYDSKIVYLSDPYSNDNTLLFVNLSSIIVYTVNKDTTFTFSFSSSFIETNTPQYGSLTFNKITSVSNYGNNLYICDNGNKSIYSYDIASVLQQDRALGYKFNLTNSTNNTQGQLSNPVLVGSSADTIFVYDATLLTIFFYDLNYNLIYSYKNEAFFTNSVPVSLTYYQVYNQLYVLTEDFNVVILDVLGNVKFIQLNTSGLVTNELARKLIFSTTNSDIVYLLTNFNLYKKFVSNIIGNIGAYSFTNNITGGSINIFTTPFLYDVSIISPPRNNPSDYIMLYGYDQLLFYVEQLTYNSIIK
jgi:hypothetical protein